MGRGEKKTKHHETHSIRVVAPKATTAYTRCVCARRTVLYRMVRCQMARKSKATATPDELRIVDGCVRGWQLGEYDSQLIWLMRRCDSSKTRSHSEWYDRNVAFYQCQLASRHSPAFSLCSRANNKNRTIGVLVPKN